MPGTAVRELADAGIDQRLETVLADGANGTPHRSPTPEAGQRPQPSGMGRVEARTDRSISDTLQQAMSMRMFCPGPAR
jgi:hypothetical protein